MGQIARSLMTIELFAASCLLLILALAVFAKLNALCPDKTTNKDCQRPLINGLLIASLVMSILGLGLSGWKVYTKFTEVSGNASGSQ